MQCHPRFPGTIVLVHPVRPGVQPGHAAGVTDSMRCLRTIGLTKAAVEEQKTAQTIKNQFGTLPTYLLVCGSYCSRRRADTD